MLKVTLCGLAQDNNGLAPTHSFKHRWVLVMNLRAQKREFILWESLYLKFGLQTDMEFDKVHFRKTVCGFSWEAKCPIRVFDGHL
jgi:hypothetical protein